MSTVAERLLGLINEKLVDSQVYATREQVLEFYAPRLEALGLAVGGKGLERKLAKKVVHIAGTKGKGSTCAMVERICRQHGLRTGLFTSPHLVQPHERFRICGKPVADQVLEKHFEKVLAVLKQCAPLPKWFGFITLLAFDIFAAHDLDVVILEVGLGGRLDSTNLIEKPDITAVTLLDLDHTEFLGDTLAEIAGEKAGIMKPGVRVITVDGQEAEALDVLEARAKQVGCALEVAKACPEDWALGLAGDYQHANAGVAIAICRSILAGSQIEQSIRLGLESCKFPGRGHIVRMSSRATFYFDGAHTPKSMQTAAQWFAEQIGEDNGGGGGETETILVFSCLHSRNPKLLFESLGPSVARRFQKIIFTRALSKKPTFVKMPSASDIMGYPVLPPPKENESWIDVLARVWGQVFPNQSPECPPHPKKQKTTTAEEKKVVVCSTLHDALQELGRLDSESPVTKHVFVTGSLLMIGDIFKLLDIKAFGDDDDGDDDKKVVN